MTSIIIMSAILIAIGLINIVLASENRRLSQEVKRLTRENNRKLFDADEIELAGTMEDPHLKCLNAAYCKLNEGLNDETSTEV